LRDALTPSKLTRLADFAIIKDLLFNSSAKQQDQLLRSSSRSDLDNVIRRVVACSATRVAHPIPRMRREKQSSAAEAAPDLKARSSTARVAAQGCAIWKTETGDFHSDSGFRSAKLYGNFRIAHVFCIKPSKRLKFLI